MQSMEETAAKKKKSGHLNRAHQTNKKQRIFDSGWFEQKQVNYEQS